MTGVMPQFESIETVNNANAADFAEGQNVLQEKVDGANFRFAREEILAPEYQTTDRDLVFGSRRQIYKNRADESNAFADAINAVRSTVSAADIKAIEDTYNAEGAFIFFGEAMCPHTLEYNFETAPAFIGFSVYDTGRDEYLPVNTAANIYQGAGFTVPQQNTVTVGLDELDETYIPESEYGPVEAEGIIVTNTETNARAKLVRDDFKEALHTAETSDEDDVISNYMTTARVVKMIEKFVTRYNYDGPAMKMMAPTDEHDGLVAEVVRDMMEEEGHNIIMNENVEIDTAKLRSKASDKVVNILANKAN